MAKLRAQRDKALQEHRDQTTEQLKLLEEDLRAAGRRRDQDSVKFLQGEIADIRAVEQEIRRSCDGAVLKVLTAGQRAKWDRHVILGKLRRDYGDVQFTDEQIAQAKTAHERLAARANVYQPGAEHRVNEELIAIVRRDILTDQQKTDLDVGEVVRRLRLGKDKLSEGQMARLRRACRAAVVGVDMSDRKKRGRALYNLQERANREILTEDQRITSGMSLIGYHYRKLKLTDAQRKKVRAIYVKHTVGVDLTDWRSRTEALKKITDEIRGQVLTAEQRRHVR